MNGFTQRVGIDKTTLELQLQQIDYEQLKKNKQSKNFHYELKNGRLQRLTLFDKEIGRLRISTRTSKVNYQPYYYCVLEMPARTNRNNLQNLTVQDFKYRINTVLQQLYFTYGLVFLEDVQVTKMEVNATIELDEDFNRYRKAIDLLIYNAPERFWGTNKTKEVKVLKALSVEHETNEIKLETAYLKNSNVQFKIYNKGKQLYDNGIVTTLQNDILRAEYTFNKKTIYRYFQNNNFVSNFTDSKISFLFFSYFTRDFVKPYEVWRKKNHEELKQKVILCRTHKPQWVSEFISYCRQYDSNHIPLLFDIEDMRTVIRELEPATATANESRKKYKRLEKQFRFTEDLQGNTKRIEEILSKIMDLK